MEEQAQRSQSIPELFKGKCVLVTGATGFLGKVLVEKLLRSCPGIRELFILLRPSKKGDVSKRLQDFLDHHVFDRLRDEQSDALQKVRELSGDVTLDNMGLSDRQLQKVVGEVSFIFHCAANVRFDDHPRNTLSVNLLGVKNVLDVCKLCTVLEAVVHVSTAFSFCNHPEISEQLYDETVKPQNIIEALRWMKDEPLHILSAHYVKGRPSLYQFSKALSEALIAESGNSLPLVIVRPSIVTASINEPFPGWIDNLNGPSGFISLCGKGVVRTLLVKPNVIADWVPVDIVVNTLIAAAHYIAVKSKCGNPTLKLSSPAGVPIINCTCPNNNLITWRKVVDICLPFLIKYPSMDVYGKPGGTVTSCPLQYARCRLVSHYIPAFFVDACYCLMGKRPRTICLYRKIHRVMGHLQHFTTHSFVFQSPNMQKLKEQMDPGDRELFPIDQSGMDWTQYVENYVLGVRRYFLRENDETLPEARVKMRRYHHFWLALKFCSVVGFLLMYALKNRQLKYFESSTFPAIASISLKFAAFSRK